MKGLRIAVVGAGLGGLCLAQGLQGAGADVTVYERDAALGIMTALAAAVPVRARRQDSMDTEHRIREAEARLFARGGLTPEESFLDLKRAGVRLRVLSAGSGPPLVMLHGVSLAAAIWAPWLADLAGYRLHLVELPGHGLSGSAAYRPGRITSLVIIGEPAVALPGTSVRMPLSLLTVPVLGEAVLRNPAPRPVYRRLLGQGLSPAAAAAAPDDLVDVLRLAARRKSNARTVASLMHAIDGFRRPRPGPSLHRQDSRSRAP